MEKTSRSSKERLADTYWPLLIYNYNTLYGPPLGRIMAHFFGCQPTSWFTADVSKVKHDNIEAFLSPAYRRRVRSSIRREWKTEIKEARREGIDVRQVARETLFYFYEGLRQELSGSNIEELSKGEIKADWPPFAELEKEIDRMDFSHIPKVGQLEAQQNREAEEIVRDAEGVAKFFSIYSVLDARVRNEILVQVGGNEGYASTVANILAEAKVNPLSIAESSSARKALIGLFSLKKELEAVEFPQVFRIIGKTIGKFMKLLMTQEGEKIAALLIGKVLIDQFAEQPYSKYRKESLEELAEKGVKPSDSHAEEWSSQIEERSVLETLLEQLPASQREDCQLFLEAGDSQSPRQLRDQLGETRYKAKQRNFQRGIKRLQDLMKSGKLDL